MRCGIPAWNRYFQNQGNLFIVNRFARIAADFSGPAPGPVSRRRFELAGRPGALPSPSDANHKDRVENTGEQSISVTGTHAA
jgi:hypothetical protein